MAAAAGVTVPAAVDMAAAAGEALTLLEQAELRVELPEAEEEHMAEEEAPLAVEALVDMAMAAAAADGERAPTAESGVSWPEEEAERYDIAHLLLLVVDPWMADEDPLDRVITLNPLITVEMVAMADWRIFLGNGNKIPNQRIQLLRI
jgi:hypothetical protein